MIYESNQDFGARMARIESITLQGDARQREWMQQNFRTMTNRNQQSFERHLHDAMGYKASTVNDWEA